MAAQPQGDDNAGNADNQWPGEESSETSLATRMSGSVEPAMQYWPRTPLIEDTSKLPQLLAGGAMLIAGILHMILVGPHLEHARGAGIMFLLMGAGQILWSIIWLREQNHALAKLGLVLLALTPFFLYILTRTMRAPWSPGPEAVDVLGIATMVMQVIASVALFWYLKPIIKSNAPQVVGLALLLCVAAYGSAMMVEDVEWFSQGESAHAHGEGDGHGDHAHGGHGDSSDNHAGHGDDPDADHSDHGSDHGHGGDTWGTEGVVVVGTKPYTGPATGAAIVDQCEKLRTPDQDCWMGYLRDMLIAYGSIKAFDGLVELIEASPEANAISHPLAHILGHDAFEAYGQDITLTLGECSYEVFQGCLHGALQAYFSKMASEGGEIDRKAIRSLCAASTNDFEIYTCLHGVGHGIMMYTNYDLHRSLELCALEDGWYKQESCYGGVFMENVVAYLDSLKPDYVPHDHGGGPPEFWVNADDLAYPCNVVEDQYGRQCWEMQTSLILNFNGGNFKEAAEVCADAGKFHLDCFRSLGRDAPPYADREPQVMSQMCSYGNNEQQRECVKAVAAGVILQANSPQFGIEICGKMWSQFKPACFTEVGRQARDMLSKAEATVVCDSAQSPYQTDCHAGRTA